MFSKMNKSENFTTGIVCVLHSYGRNLKWNPHIHALISEGGAGNHTPWRIVKHFDYHFLWKTFRKVLLDHLARLIGPYFRNITRYLGRPIIAASSIDQYDGEQVTFHYNRHEDNSLVTETIPALNFIKRLIIHIPKKHFKMVRYYGIYTKHHKQDPFHHTIKYSWYFLLVS